jgi:starch synthase
MKTLFVTSELAGLAKAGGLADVSLALPRALGGLGVDCRVLLPGYPEVLAHARAISVVAALPGQGEIDPCLLGELDLPDGPKVYVVLAPALYHRPGTPYLRPDGSEWPDNDLRFARLSLAGAQIARGVPGLPWRPDLVHTNDWPAGLTAAYLAHGGRRVPSVHTVHNIAHLGLYPPSRLGALGLPDEAFGLAGVEFYGHLSFLKAGIYYADHVTTVSPTYAVEITGPAHGNGLQGLMQALAAEGRLTGIVNGLDARCDPRIDPRLDYHFTADDLAGKRQNADFVRQCLCLDQNARGPLFAISSRLVHQKGLDLVEAVAPGIVEAGGQIAILGVGEPAIETMMLDLSRRYRGSVGLMAGYNETLAHRLVAGSDFYLMPSRFEPCGLTQLQAQRCGSLPIAHATGGLVDTIEDGVSGFLFQPFGAEPFAGACARAIEAYHDPVRLAALRRHVMALDLGWGRPAQDYKAIYARLTGTTIDEREPDLTDTTSEPTPMLRPRPRAETVIETRVRRISA